MLGVSRVIFTGIMTLKSPKNIYNYLKGKYEGNMNIQDKKVLNLIRKFELERMKEHEIIKKYLNKLISITNKINLLRKQFSNFKLVWDGAREI